MLDHECAPTLPAHDEPLRGEVADRFAGRALADPELGCDLELVGDKLTWLPLARADALDQAFAHQGVERPTAVVVGQAHGHAVCRNRPTGLPALSYIRIGRLHGVEPNTGA